VTLDRRPPTPGPLASLELRPGNQAPTRSRYYVRVVGKALGLFIAFDLLQAAAGLPGRLENLSLYRHLVPPAARMDIMRDDPSSVMWRL